MSTEKRARDAKRLFMQTKKEMDDKKVAVEEAMAKMVELRGKLMGFDVQRAEHRLAIATANRNIAQAQACSSVDEQEVKDLQIVITVALEEIAKLDLEAAKILMEHDSIQIKLRGV